MTSPPIVWTSARWQDLLTQVSQHAQVLTTVLAPSLGKGQDPRLPSRRRDWAISFWLGQRNQTVGRPASSREL